MSSVVDTLNENDRSGRVKEYVEALAQDQMRTFEQMVAACQTHSLSAGI